jgi:L-asparagine transporter-like permease
MPGFPAVQIAGIILLSALLITMGLDKDWNLSWIVGVPWLILLTGAYFLSKARGAKGPARGV